MEMQRNKAALFKKLKAHNFPKILGPKAWIVKVFPPLPLPGPIGRTAQGSGTAHFFLPSAEGRQGSPPALSAKQADGLGYLPAFKDLVRSSEKKS
jgi:hypothetical protein